MNDVYIRYFINFCITIVTIILFTYLWLLINVVDAHAVETQGLVTKVYDGDTITVHEDNCKCDVKVRMLAIDAPELKQPYGIDSRNYLKTIVLGKRVNLSISKKDLYGRSLAYVKIGDMNINLDMVQNGLAWVYMNKDPIFIKSENEAKLKLKGLWIDTNPIRPSEYRKQYKVK